MVKRIILNDISFEKNEILTLIENKIALGLIADFIEDRNIFINDIEKSLNSIEVKFKNINKIYEIYFTELNTEAFNNIPYSNPLILDFEIHHNDTTIELFKQVIDNHSLYAETIISNFQMFILYTATLFENIVLLIDTLLYKVLIYSKNYNNPQSSHFNLFNDYWKQMVKYEYKKDPDLISCFNPENYKIISSKYMDVIMILRNKYIHGTDTFLIPHGNSYALKVINFNRGDSQRGNLSQLSDAELEIQAFVDVIYNGSKSFISNLLHVLNSKLRNDEITIPFK